MSEMKHPEELLHSWKPRNPSPEIRRRLFGKPAEKPAARGGIFPLFAPAAACLLALSSFIFTGDNSPSPIASPVLFASISSNAMFNPCSDQRMTLSKTDGTLQQNIWDRATFDWTNEHLSTSSIRSLSLNNTNELR